jgi:hypothetical protein
MCNHRSAMGEQVYCGQLRRLSVNDHLIGPGIVQLLQVKRAIFGEQQGVTSKADGVVQGAGLKHLCGGEEECVLFKGDVAANKIYR